MYSYLKTSAIILLLLSIIPFVAHAQRPDDSDEKGCKLNLNLAEDKYKNGQIDEVIDLIKPCVQGNSNLNKQDKIRMYKLLIITYLYLNEHEEASIYMKDFLSLNPEYQVEPNVDPSEFIDLFYQFRTRPVAILGLKVGVNSSLVNVRENYSLDNSNTALGTYSTVLGYNATFSAEFPLSKHFSVATGLVFSHNSFDYTARQFGYSVVGVKESMLFIGIPLNARFNFTKDDFRLYFQLGATANRLLSAHATLARLDSLNQDLGIQSVVGPTEEVLDQREQYSFSAQAALGFHWKNLIGKGYLMFEIGYSYGLNNLVRTESRYDNTNLIYKYNYIPNDFSLNQLTIDLGYAIPIYKPKKLKNKKSKNL
ncbi:hypothetical protein BFP72_06185 [Reichenbachiella sp. 5M10]|uniref:porin family protein n=1 Tax=Reichenbachiella sp. 5M10 TaxID=1889772 RepID=UPI000C3F1BAF|nr:porin family protein [Reichenbachiella sp. 5M10]PIB35009.1 hypothetical protein BFP72_06185 [Reichenbachiella sp. 5M10]